MAACVDPAAMAELLKDHNAEWTQRREALGLIRRLILSPEKSNEFVLSYLTNLQPLICIQLEDRRSIYCKEVCELITTFATRLGNSFESLSDGFMAALFPLLVVTIRVIAESAHKCILSLLPFSTSSIPLISQGVKDKHPFLRARCTEYMCKVVETTSADKLDNASSFEAVHDAIRNAIGDSNAEARTLAKRTYQAFNKRFPAEAQKLYSSLDSSLQNRLVEAKPAPKKGGFADFLAKKQAASKPNNVDCGVMVQDAMVVSKTGDDNKDNDGNSSSPSGSSSPNLSSSSSASTSNTTSASLTSTSSPPATQSHSLAVDIITTPVTETIQQIISQVEEKVVVEAIVLPVSEPVVAEPIVEATVPEPAPVEADIITPVESITMDATIPSPSPSSPSPSEDLEAPETIASSPAQESEIETTPTTTTQAESELAVLSDDDQSSSSADESRPALSELLSETTERIPSPLSDRRSIGTEEKSASPEPTSNPTTKDTKTTTTTKPIIKPKSTLKPTNSAALSSSTSSRALRSMTNVTKPTTTKEPVKKTTTSTTVSKKTTRAVYSEDKENQCNIVRSTSTEPKPAKKLRVSTPPSDINSIAARVKTTRRAAAVVATSTLVKSSSSSSLTSTKKSTTALKTKTATKRPWL